MTGSPALDPAVCGIDGSPASDDAVRQAAALCGDDGRIILVGVATPAAATHPEAALALARGTGRAISAAARLLAPDRVEQHELEGDPATTLIRCAERFDAGLLSVGSHGGSRIGGIVAGSVATAVIHLAPSSVLVARPARAFPSRIVVGTDGSPSSLHAVEVAEQLPGELVVIAAAGSLLTSRSLSPRAVAALRIDARDAVAAMLDAAEDGDLLVVGSRGLTGLKAIGSVSERLAHRAPVSVLIVR